MLSACKHDVNTHINSEGQTQPCRYKLAVFKILWQPPLLWILIFRLLLLLWFQLSLLMDDFLLSSFQQTHLLHLASFLPFVPSHRSFVSFSTSIDQLYLSCFLSHQRWAFSFIKTTIAKKRGRRKTEVVWGEMKRQGYFPCGLISLCFLLAARAHKHPLQFTTLSSITCLLCSINDGPSTWQ